ncbi:hypothetical protein QBC46DRAFT_433026 [Diplogelasinospora grovesii]|uniref:Uncharacterized protein n=1 Tax=Diplogelasinospora grovesii TaxID=303347 RepID=A0AAN6RYA1_9PEZI|nr:hypothetical protein QBC46DRAFT_433026 [Diplogelasinospora grovesii]
MPQFSCCTPYLWCFIFAVRLFLSPTCQAVRQQFGDLLSDFVGKGLVGGSVGGCGFSFGPLGLGKVTAMPSPVPPDGVMDGKDNPVAEGGNDYSRGEAERTAKEMSLPESAPIARSVVDGGRPAETPSKQGNKRPLSPDTALTTPRKAITIIASNTPGKIEYVRTPSSKTQTELSTSTKSFTNKFTPAGPVASKSTFTPTKFTPRQPGPNATTPTKAGPGATTSAKAGSSRAGSAKSVIVIPDSKRRPVRVLGRRGERYTSWSSSWFWVGVGMNICRRYFRGEMPLVASSSESCVLLISKNRLKS